MLRINPDRKSSGSMSLWSVFALLGSSILVLVLGGNGTNKQISADPVHTAAQWALLAAGEALYLPAAAHVTGAVGTNWRSDLELFNSGSGPAQFDIALLVQNQANTNPLTITSTLDPGTSIRYNDVLHSLFGFNGSASLRIVASTGELMATSRTYNQTESGTYGQFIGGVPESLAITEADEGRIIQLRHNISGQSGYRTNLGLLNATDSQLTVSIDLFSGNGALLGTTNSSLGPFAFRQINRVFERVTSQNVGNGYAVVKTETAGGRFFAYASVVDNTTGDPVYVPAEILRSAKTADPGEVVYVAAAAHVSGAGDTQWRTDMAVHNPDSSLASYEIAVLRTNQNNTSPLTSNVTVPGGASRVFEDLLQSEFGLDGTAAVRVSPRGGGARAIVASRTYNQTDSGTYGQFIAGTPDSDSLVFGQGAVILQLSHHRGKTNTYRTNLGVVSAVANTIGVEVDLHNSNGTLLGTVNITLGPFMHKQINRIFERVTQTDVEDGYAVVRSTTENGRFIAYASVVDNRTADPVLVPATALQTTGTMDPSATVERLFSWLTNSLGQGSVPYVDDAIETIMSDGIDTLLDSIASAKPQILSRSGQGIEVDYTGGRVLSDGSVANGSLLIEFTNVDTTGDTVNLGFSFSNDGLTIDGQGSPIDTITGSAHLERDASANVRGTIDFSGMGGRSDAINTVSGHLEIDTFLCVTYPIGGAITFQIDGQAYHITFSPDCDGSYQQTDHCGDVMDDVPPGSLALWDINDQPENPVLYYEEISSPYDGSTAINTRAVGDTWANCKSDGISRTFDVGPSNTSSAHLEAYLEFSFDGTRFNQPQFIVGLLDETDAQIGEVHVFYGKNILCEHFAENVIPNRGWQYTELSSAAGYHRFDLTKIGDDLDFSKIKIYLINYTCIGENSIILDHLVLVRDCE